MIDVRALVTHEARDEQAKPGDVPRQWVAVEASAMYPAMADHIRDEIASGKLPAPEVAQFFDEARNLLSSNGAALNLMHTWHAGAQGYESTRKAIRNAMLNVARKWFTALLHAEHGGAPMGLHIVDPTKAYREA